MENKKLAILGNPTRGKEVIKILEMLGGKNLKGTGTDETCIYTIDSTSSFIEPIPFYDFSSKYYDNLHTEYYIFTLENFLKKYPLKVGDKVKTIYGKIGNVSKCKWDADNNCMTYKLDTSVYNDSFYFAHELIPHKEEIKAEDHTEIYTDHAIVDDSKTDIIINGEKLIAPNGYTIGNATRNSNKLIVEYIKNKPQYPKTYKECCEVLGINTKANDAQGYKADDIICLQELLIYRDAYWKIAGEEMGLSEPWKPSANDEGKTHSLYYNRCTDSLDKCEGLFESNAILDFPTKEMRDAFFENFKDLIEKCKEFL